MFSRLLRVPDWLYRRRWRQDASLGARVRRRTRVRGLTEEPGSIGFAVPDMRLRRVARLNGKKNTGVTT
ncbi:hypothetical protein GCM10015536_23710 [Streptomyces griseomycini]|nr:hypothetical protein GCM10015536_23710 [Streptomyces griseomycini]